MVMICVCLSPLFVWHCRGSKNGQAQGKKHGQGQGSSQGRARQPSPGSGGPERRRTARLSEEALEVCREALDSGKGVTAETVLRTLRGTDFPPNTSRKSVMPEGQTSIDAFCLGLVGSRSPWPVTAAGEGIAVSL